MKADRFEREMSAAMPFGAPSAGFENDGSWSGQDGLYGLSGELPRLAGAPALCLEQPPRRDFRNLYRQAYGQVFPEAGIRFGEAPDPFVEFEMIVSIPEALHQDVEQLVRRESRAWEAIAGQAPDAPGQIMVTFESKV